LQSQVVVLRKTTAPDEFDDSQAVKPEMFLVSKPVLLGNTSKSAIVS
jgi:hypothetical protein